MFSSCIQVLKIIVILTAYINGQQTPPLIISDPNTLYIRQTIEDLGSNNFSIKKIVLNLNKPKNGSNTVSNFQQLSEGLVPDSEIDNIKEDLIITEDSVCYIYTSKQNAESLKIIPSLSILLDTKGQVVKNLTRDIDIQLTKKKPQEKFSILTVGTYTFLEKILGISTLGKLLAISSSDSSTPTRIIYFGNYDPFQKTSGKDEGLMGYLVDDLDYENRQNQIYTFIGPVGPYMAFITCGISECEVYYSEILAGQLYVGHLFTLNDGKGQDVIEEFCPVEILTDTKKIQLFVKSKCSGEDKFSYYTIRFGYKKYQIVLFDEYPEDVKEEDDLEFCMSKDNVGASFLYSLKAQKIYVRNLINSSWEFNDFSNLIKNNEVITQIICNQSSEYHTFLVFSPSAEDINAKEMHFIFGPKKKGLYCILEGSNSIG